MVSKNAINCRLQAPGLPYYFIRLNTGALFQEGGGGVIIASKPSYSIANQNTFCIYWFLMGTLHEMVTWDKNTLVRKRKQWGKKNKEPRSFKKLISFLFKLPLHWIPYSKAFLYHVTALCKGPISF